MEWHDDLLLGVPEVDEEHRAMFEHFVALACQCEAGADRGLLLDKVDLLLDEARAHFATEECLMARYGYPQVDDQRRHHAWFQRDLEHFAARILQDGPTAELALTIRGKLIQWLIQHIIEVDRRMVEFVKLHQAA